ncbi:MAG TPA: hypothetical protein VF173_25600 [Thermoanaerobaculia bacterium]|nr:hypothetical protein [Thermoanaerobaculia bacterium]
MDGSPGPKRPRGLQLLALALACAVWGAAALSLGCGPSGPSGKAGPSRQSPASAAEWQWLQKTQAALTEQRHRLAAADPAGAAAAREALRQQTATLAAELDRRLVAFINADPPVEGQPLTARQKAAIRMKSDEDAVLARRFIDEGGDYQRAIAIYEEALAVDPDYPQLVEELARARSRRYTSREAFAQLKKGMSPEEVRGLLGPPNLHNVRDYPDRGVAGWFYPRDASGAAAAVWFAKNEGRMTVYLLDFDALKPVDPQTVPQKPAPKAPAAT